MAFLDNIYLREFTEDERSRLAKTGKALPDGSFPILTVEDLRNAIQAIGRAKSPAAARAHIIKRARALGQTGLLPEEWLATAEEFVYGGVDDLPDAVKSRYSSRCQSVFLRVFNTTMKNGQGEERAFQNAHTAAKNCES